MKTRFLNIAGLVAALPVTALVYGADLDQNAPINNSDDRPALSPKARTQDEQTRPVDPASDTTSKASDRINGAPPNARVNRADMADREDLGKLTKASEFMGRDVMSSQNNEKLGDIKDFAVDLKSGRIVLVVVSTSKLGIGGNYYAVAPQALKCQHDGKTVTLDMTAEHLKTAPTIELSHWDDAVTEQQITMDYQFYDKQPYFVKADGTKAAQSASTTARLGTVLRANQVIGMHVQNRQEEKLGSVDNLMVNLEHGRVAQVILSSGGFLGIGDELSAVPPAAFEYDPNKKLLLLDATKATLGSAPHFKKSEWPDVSDPTYANTVYRSYQVEPYFHTVAINSSDDSLTTHNPVRGNADNSARNAQDRNTDNLTPVDQGSSPADVATTRAIRRELVAQEKLSTNAKNVKVITVNGEVTLRGPVNTTEEKKVVEEIATHNAPDAKVNNQLVVKNDD